MRTKIKINAVHCEFNDGGGRTEKIDSGAALKHFMYFVLDFPPHSKTVLTLTVCEQYLQLLNPFTRSVLL